jgi:hypothetical protein
MLLGAIMNKLKDETAAAETLLSLGDLVLVAHVEAARLPHEECVGEYVSGAAQRFARLASDEDWLRLMTALERSDRPAATSLDVMVRWSIARDANEAQENKANGGCSCGGSNGGCHDQA